MATLDFTPFFRSTVGYDRIPSLLTHALERDDGSWNYPPYNIEKCGDDEYRIVMALAGFRRDDLEVVCERNQLVVRGRMSEPDGKVYLHHGIAARAFERKFDLAEFVVVTGASMEDGLLSIDLKRELPEELKPRRVEINAAKSLRIQHTQPEAA